MRDVPSQPRGMKDCGDVSLDNTESLGQSGSAGDLSQRHAAAPIRVDATEKEPATVPFRMVMQSDPSSAWEAGP
jgi:hypothetical protein